MTTPYCNLANVREWLTGLQIAQTSDDTLLTELIDRASDAIDTHLCRGILSQSTTEIKSGNDSSSIFVRNYPITAVSLVMVDGYVYPQAADTISFGYLFDNERVYLRGGKFHRGIQNVVISYTGGYTTIPHDITMACVEIVAHHYKSRNHIGIVSHSTNGVTTDSFQQDIPGHLKCKLERYVRVMTL